MVEAYAERRRPARFRDTPFDLEFDAEPAVVR